mmetsp:Transcript_16827/g.24699  ORF Transcript_16827/g.24699 Transcript_16827/m.24699 type:complete len:143 (-) Transcript_16827:186-614(-)
MTELGLDTEGTSILTASCYDARHPPEHVIDGETNTFWATTGSFPQEIIVQLQGLATIQRIQTQTMNVQQLVVEKCSSAIATSWEKVTDTELQERDSGMQTQTHECPPRMAATFLKFRIEKGWSEYCTLHKISIQGSIQPPAC